MKASVYTSKGPPPVFQVMEIDTPTPRDDEVLVRVHAASVNSWDWELMPRAPSRVNLGRRSDPRYKILGADVAGTVETVGKDVRRFRPGDDVMGDLSGSGWGGYAEYTCAHEDALTLKPSGLTFDEAAATPQAGLLALQGLMKRGQVQPGQEVLINGAGGGVGTFAVQIAKSFGATVTGVDRADKFELMRSIGADVVIDYKEEDFTSTGHRYDVILDVKGYRPLAHYLRSLRHGGRAVFVGGTWRTILKVLFLGPLISPIMRRGLMLVILRRNRDLDVLLDMVGAGKVKPIVDRRYQLEEVAEAIQYLGDGHVKGKVVITVHHPART